MKESERLGMVELNRSVSLGRRIERELANAPADRAAAAEFKARARAFPLDENERDAYLQTYHVCGRGDPPWPRLADAILTVLAKDRMARKGLADVGL